MHTICTHTETETETETNKQRYMQHREQNIEDTHREQHREQHTENRTQDTTICSAHNYRTYSFDLYHEQIYIKNSNTIELYTILQDKV